MFVGFGQDDNMLKCLFSPCSGILGVFYSCSFGFGRFRCLCVSCLFFLLFFSVVLFCLLFSFLFLVLLKCSWCPFFCWGVGVGRGCLFAFVCYDLFCLFVE